MKYSGKIDVSNKDGVWRYDVPQCHYSDKKITFDFHGTDRNGHPFSGNCVAYIQDEKNYDGEGTFKYKGYDEYKSKIKLTAELNDKLLELSGEWLDDGNLKYEIDGELKLVG